MLISMTDLVHEDISDTLGALPPEQMGVIFTHPMTFFVADFLHDVEAKRSITSVSASPRLARDSARIERERGLCAAGIVHSHPPGGPNSLSSEDIRRGAETLQRNRHLPYYLLGLVIPARNGDTPIDGIQDAPHVIGLVRSDGQPAGTLSMFAALRRKSGGAEVIPMTLHVIPARRDAESIRAALGLPQDALRFRVDSINGISMCVATLDMNGGTLNLGFSEHYPLAPPLVVVSRGSVAEPLSLSWPVALPENERLQQALKVHFTFPLGGAALRKWYGSVERGPLTACADTARIAGWQTIYSGRSPKQERAKVRRGLASRAPQSTILATRRARVTLAGLGSVGSMLAAHLCRCGVENFTLIDADTAQAENLSRSTYTMEDIGKAKTDALASHLLKINPAINLRLLNSTVQAIPQAELMSIVSKSDLVIAATDSPEAQARLNRYAWAQTPTLYVGLYQKAEAGEVILVLPRLSPCYMCAMRVLRQPVAVHGPTNYATGRFLGEIGLGADISAVVARAAHLAGGVLELKGAIRTMTAVSPNAELVAAHAKNSNVLLITNSRDHRSWRSLFDRCFDGVNVDSAFRSLWVTIERQNDCPVCGAEEFRAASGFDPLIVMPDDLPPVHHKE